MFSTRTTQTKAVQLVDGEATEAALRSERDVTAFFIPLRRVPRPGERIAYFLGVASR